MAESAFKRAERVGQLIQQELAPLLVDGVMDPRVGFVTVTEVRVSDDLRNARVYVSVYGTDEQQADTLAGLRDAAGFLKRELGKRVRLKYTPNLNFSYDESLDRAQRLDELLSAASDGAIATPDPSTHEVVPVQTARSDLAARKDDLEAARAEKKVTQERALGDRRSNKRRRRGRR